MNAFFVIAGLLITALLVCAWRITTSTVKIRRITKGMRRRGLMCIVLLLPSNLAVAENALWQLNAQRAYFGLYPLQPDAHLQAKAEETCRIMAARGLRGHIYGRPAAGRWEGTGNRSGQDWQGMRFYTCYQNHRQARRAGAAYVVTGSQTYYVLLLDR